MEVINYSEFRQSLKAHLDNVTDNHDTLIVPRGEDKGVVIISLVEWNSIQETLHLMRSDKNRARLTEALNRADEGISEDHQLID
ncbi:type II toxin-antitoxin system Phd/YefM family antitoxin [Chitinophaga barathri]|uniref:Antitoxin n=1 Tax=Chitinophaga barathri TaxID=1647451 RepID=A0A3N4M6Z3_9BACT|nr:type II toxin-antitoxin system Phd/YefM family antitoxin [Chitinophaga barathri]RPD39204.1 type II toxin-antitoxin system prevent-host-death family antitoxin [Chitinophaga barathri]